MEFLTKFLIFNILNFAVFSFGNHFNNLSFDTLFAQTGIEQIQKNNVEMVSIIKDFKTSDQTVTFLDKIFDSIIELHFLLMLMEKEKINSSKDIMPIVDIGYCRSNLSYVRNLFENTIRNNQNTKFNIINALFDQADERLEKFS